ncbi:MAG: Fur family transcriptional regulator [Acidimicrobiales bacterium]
MSDLLERLRAGEWRLTPQRRVVAEVLDGEHVHLTAEAVHAQAQARLPEISLATVYNTLNELVAMGQVIEVPGAGGARRYDANAQLAHHHLVCTSCGELWDVFPAGERALVLNDGDRHHFEITGVQIVFQGLCPSCSAS